MNALRSGDPTRLGAGAESTTCSRPRWTCSRSCGGLWKPACEYGALGALVSGSGPTCAFLVGSESAAIDLSVALSAEGVCRTVRRATGPVVGARVIG